MVIARAPFKKIGATDLGAIRRPFVEAQLFAREQKTWIPVEALVDSGADYTMLPRRYADMLGIDVNVDCEAIRTSGVGGSETVYLYRLLPIKIGAWQKRIPVGFLERDDIPPLLGRMGCLEALEVTFKNYETVLKQ